MGREKSRMKGLYMLWNMVDGREKTELYQVYEAVMKELYLNAFFLLSSIIRKNSGRLSVVPVKALSIYSPITLYSLRFANS